MWQSLSVFSFSSLLTLTLYFLIGGSSAEAELSKVPKTQLTAQNPLVSQAPSQPMQQGKEVSLNGRKFSVAWSQWNQDNSVRTGISDTGAMQVLGLELLSTNNSTVQPVLWFSGDSNRPISLATRSMGSYRYLDITDLAQLAGAQVRVVGNTLNIEVPPPRIANVRQGNQPWGKRLVVDLDRPAFWQVSQAPNQGAVIIEGSADSSLLARFKPTDTAANSPQSVDQDDVGTSSGAAAADKPLFSLVPAGKTTKLLINLPTAYGLQVSSVPNPNRLIVDIRADAMKEREIVWKEGIKWGQKFVKLNQGFKQNSFPVNWLEIDLRTAGLSLKPITTNGSSLEGTAPIATTAQFWQAAAAINGGFFNRNNRLPLGAIRQDNRWLSGPILNRGAIAWDDRGNVKIGRLSLQETVTTSNGNRLSVSYLNSGYVQAGIARYTKEWGANYRTLSDKETVVFVQGDRVVELRQAGAAGQDAFPIPADGYLLTLRKNDPAISALATGTQVTLTSNTAPAEFANYPQILGAGPLLLQNRQIVLNAAAEQFTKAFQDQTASRSAIATTDRGTLIMVTVHNRVGGKGATLTEMAQLLQQLGAVDALNLDGGSSTSLSLGGQLIDRSPVTAARVHNGIGVFISP